MNKLGNSIHQNLILVIQYPNNITFNIFGIYLGSLNEAKPHIQEFVELTKPKNKSYVERDWYHANINTVWKKWTHFKITSFYIDSTGLSYEGVEYLMEFMRNFKCVFNVRTMLIGGGKANEIERNEMAFVYRNFMYFLGIGLFLDEDNYETCIEDLKSFSRVFQKNYTSFESYQNYIERALENWQCRYYGEYFEKLVEIKQKYDPNNLFNWNQSIPTTTEISCY
ncbi:10824_t:CDS:1 [Racocetra persica]|uniref:10824_t:CDS:1 n=1 Tax=Racocetra persica TaxID=160502 RepID=A0ACA9Q1W1_9GLOM|nr:10824_t:CDS:1 [Racocetra persica]